MPPKKQTNTTRFQELNAGTLAPGGTNQFAKEDARGETLTVTDQSGLIVTHISFPEDAPPDLVEGIFDWTQDLVGYAGGEVFRDPNYITRSAGFADQADYNTFAAGIQQGFGLQMGGLDLPTLLQEKRIAINDILAGANASGGGRGGGGSAVVDQLRSLTEKYQADRSKREFETSQFQLAQRQKALGLDLAAQQQQAAYQARSAEIDRARLYEQQALNDRAYAVSEKGFNLGQLGLERGFSTTADPLRQLSNQLAGGAYGSGVRDYAQTVQQAKQQDQLTQIDLQREQAVIDKENSAGAILTKMQENENFQSYIAQQDALARKNAEIEAATLAYIAKGGAAAYQAEKAYEAQVKALQTAGTSTTGLPRLSSSLPASTGYSVTQLAQTARQNVAAASPAPAPAARPFPDFFYS